VTENDTLLDLSRAQRGALQLELEPVFAERLLAETLKGLHETANQVGVSIAHSPRQRLGRVLADPARMRQILCHMIVSAVGRASAGGEVRVVGRRMRRSIAIAVGVVGESNGDEAIDGMRNLERMLCRRLAELLGGTLLGGGLRPGPDSTWTLTLPVLGAEND
jgi:hypothetical protein